MATLDGMSGKEKQVQKKNNTVLKKLDHASENKRLNVLYRDHRIIGMS